MKIGVDCHVLSGLLQGSRTYLLNLYKAILELRPKHEFVFFGHWSGDQPFGNSVEYVEYPSFSRLRRLVYESAFLVKKNKIDLFHSNYISPLILPCKSLLTIHDVLFESHPQFFTKSFVLRSKFFVKLSAHRATQIHTVSRFSKQSIQQVYGVEPSRIYLIPNGVDRSVFSYQGKEEAVKQVKKIFHLEKYILTVGRLEPRKNHVNLIKAYSLLRKSDVTIGPLVIIGQRDFGYSQVFDVIRENQLESDVHVLENIDDSFLPILYRAARVFVYPSFAEGFGIPILEALSCGLPTITSNTTAIPEVIGTAGIIVNPYEVSELATAINNVLTNTTLAKKMSNDTLLQSAKFTWNHAAENYLSAIDHI